MTETPKTALSASLRTAYDAARQRLGLDASMAGFVARITRALERRAGSPSTSEPSASPLAGIHTVDLYLTVACAEGNEAAWTRFDNTYRSYMADVAGSVTHTTGMAREVADAALAALALPGRSGPLQIAAYDGLCRLATWLRAVVLNRAMNELKKKRRATDGIEAALGVSDGGAAALQMELAQTRTRYRVIIAESLKIASAELPADERVILLLHYEQGLKLEEIGSVRGVSASTVCRQIKRSHEKIATAFRSALTAKYMLDENSVRECVALLLNGPGHSLLELIRES